MASRPLATLRAVRGVRAPNCARSFPPTAVQQSSPQPRCRLPIRRSLHTSPILRGGQAASFPFIQKQNLQAKVILFQRQEKDLSEDLPSIAATRQEMLAQGEMPEDIGLLTSTLIVDGNVPLDLPSSWWSFQRNRVVKRGREFLALMVYWWHGRRKYKLNLLQRTREAERLHRMLYEAFADNDIVKLKRIAVEGLRDRLLNRMLARPKGIGFHWTLHKYTGLSRVMSDRTAMVPAAEGQEPKYLRQIVVRIRSVQSMERVVGDVSADQAEILASRDDGQAREQRITEYVVLQKQILEGKDVPWKIWGTTTPTPADDILRVAADTRGDGGRAQEAAP